MDPENISNRGSNILDNISLMMKGGGGTSFLIAMLINVEIGE